jgi:alanyl-tRNA synthetase
MALFGEKYGESVRTISILMPEEKNEPGKTGTKMSYELCGGTHLNRTSDVGAFFIISESSAAAGVRRIEAVTGRGAYLLAARRFKLLNEAAAALRTSLDETAEKATQLQEELSEARKQVAVLKKDLALSTFSLQLENVQVVSGIRLVTGEVPGLDKETLGSLADTFRQKFPQEAICVLGTVNEEQVIVMGAVTQDLIKQGIKAGDLVGYLSQQMGAGGGGAPHLAFGGGRDASKFKDALASVKGWIEGKAK